MIDNHSHVTESVKVTGVPTTADDHPALRKVARAIISMALRGINPPTTMPPETDTKPITTSSPPVATVTGDDGDDRHA